MLKNLNMAGKMILGFGAVLVIIAAVIIVTVFNMFSIQSLAGEMKNENLPEVSLATNLESDSLQAMLNMRGYVLNFDENFRTAAEGNIAKISEDLKDEINLSKNDSNLVDRIDIINKIAGDFTNYSEGTDQIKSVINLILEQRKILEKSADIFKEQASSFLNSQEDQYRSELEAGKSNSAMLERMNKIGLINDVIDLGNEARVNAFKAQLYVNYTIADYAVALLNSIDSKLVELRRITSKQSNLDEIISIDNSRTAYAASMSEIGSLYQQLAEINSSIDADAEKVLESAQNIAAEGFEQTISKAENTVKTISSSMQIIIAGFAAAILISVLIAVFLTISITRALAKGVGFAQELSEGNLTTDLDVKQKDEIGKLADALRNMKERLREVVLEVRGSALMVSQGSEQLSTTAEQISQGATEQASTTEEVSSSMEEIGASIRQNTDNASQTEKIASKAAVDAETGGTAVQEAVDAMNLIAEKIRVIEEIARNTNLLSLNAAIEAARAGEHGKGFAVVAAEVGKLAANSQAAANEILGLANTSVEKADNAGEKIKAIIPDIRQTADLVQEISATSSEQNTGAEQVNQVMVQLDQVIQQNAAASEESSSMSEELSSQAEKLLEIIEFFKVDEFSRTTETFSKKSDKGNADKMRSKTKIETAPPLQINHRKNAEVQIDAEDDNFEEF
jgi:methyl-accepting chemotaxis protein